MVQSEYWLRLHSDQVQLPGL